ncbi:MAG: hypothetical protein AB1571_01310 [Nanoarchaeota archaeon]
MVNYIKDLIGRIELYLIGHKIDKIKKISRGNESGYAVGDFPYVPSDFVLSDSNWLERLAKNE